MSVYFTKNLNKASQIEGLDNEVKKIVNFDKINEELNQLSNSKADSQIVLNELKSLKEKIKEINESLKHLDGAYFPEGGITSDKLTITDGFIKDAMIDGLSAGKITSGSFDTTKADIVSKNGNLIIKDNTIQIRDTSKVRVQIGKDASGDYNMYVWDINGNLMFNATGITANAIKNKIIRDDMVSDNANIDAKKLNIESLIREVNNSGSTIKASKINLDGDNQTLEIAFKKLSTENDENKKNISSALTKIEVQQGQIEASISESKIIKDKQEKLQNDYNNTVVTVNSIKNTIGQHTTLIDNTTGKVTAVESKTNTLEKSLDSVTQSIEETNRAMADNQNILEKKTSELKQSLDGISASVGTLKETTNAINNSIDSVNNNLSNDIKTNFEKAISTAENLALEKSNIAKKYADNVATAKAELAKQEAIANSDGKIDIEEKARIKQAQDNLNIAISKADKAKEDAILEAKNVAELKKQEAINIASQDASTKVNNMFNSAKAYTNAEINTVNNNISKATSEINILKDKIESKVSQSDIDKSISEIKFGGRNILINRDNFRFTGSDYGTPDTTTPGKIIIKNPVSGFNAWEFINNTLSQDINIEDPYCISIDLKANGLSKNMYISLDYRDSNNSPFYAEKTNINLDKTWNRFTIKMKSQHGHVLSEILFAIGSDRKDCGISEINYKNIKVEKGTLPTSDSEAPEDLNSFIVNKIKVVTDKVNTVESTLVQKTNSIEAGVRDLNSSTQTITANVSNVSRDLTNKINSNLDVAKNFATEVAIAKANLAQVNAIANADGKIDVEEKARIKQAQDNLNTAIVKADKVKQDAIAEANRVAELKKNEAINSAKNYTNAEITTVNSKVHNVESNINILSDKINTKVSQSDIDKSIQNVTLGNRNYLKNSFLNVKNSNYCIANLSLGDEKPKEGEEFTISIKGDLGKGKESFGIYNSGGTVSLISLDNKNSYGIYKGTFKWIIGSSNNTSISIYTLYSSVTVDSSIEWVKLEKGNKVSNDWSPAPEDTDKLIADSIKTVSEKIKTVESTLTQKANGIEANVRNLDSTTQTITTNISNMGKDLTNKISTNLEAAKTFANDIAINKTNNIRDELTKYTDQVAKAKADLAQANAIAAADGKISDEEKKRIQQAEANLNIAIARADKAKADAKIYSDTLGQQLKANAEKYANDVAIAKSNLAKEQAIANADGKISAEEQKRISEAKKNLDLAILKSTEAETKAKAHADAIAEQKKNEALESSKTYTNAQITTVSNNIHNVESSLNILSNKISTKVSQEDVDRTVNSIQFGDVNMLIDAGNFKDNVSSHWGITNGEKLFIENGYLVAKFRNYAPWGCYLENDSLKDKPLDTTKNYTIVVKLKANKSKNVSFNICDGNSSNYVFNKDLSLTTTWQTFKFTFKPAGVGNERQFRFITAKGEDFDLHIAFCKMVEGSIASDSYSPSPEDMNLLVGTGVKSVDEKINKVSSELTQTKNSITASINSVQSRTNTIESNLNDKANKQEVSNVNNKVATIEANLNGISQRVGSTETQTKAITTNINNMNSTLVGKINSSLDEAKKFADSVSNQKKSEAISAAAADATNKSNTAKEQAIADSKNYVNAQVSTVNQKISSAESSINILKNQISLKVEKTDMDKAKTELVNRINSADNLANNTNELAKAMNLGKMLYSDPTFKNSSNGINVYNNKGNGTVTVTRVSKIEGCPSDSKYCMEIKCVGEASPNYGGFYFGTPSRANAVFVTRIIAKIPKGLTIGWYSNATGNNGNAKWLTPINGTGKWEEYIHLLKCGDSGSYSSTNFFATDGSLKPSTTSPVIWYLAYATVFDLTENDESVNILKNEMITTKNQVASIEINVNGITQRVSATESKTHTIESNLNSKASKNEVSEVNNRISTIKTNLDSITQRVSTTESKANTLESNLNSKASKQDVSSVNSKVSEIQTSINGITQKISNTESKTNSLETVINGRVTKEELATTNKKVTDIQSNINGITQRVSSAESRINTVDGKVNNAVTNEKFSEFKQSVDNFNWVVGQRSNVSNILPNSTFNGGIRGWQCGCEFWSGTYNGYDLKGRTCGAMRNKNYFNNEKFLQTYKAYKVKKNTTYTINFHYVVEKNVDSMEAYAILSDSESCAYVQAIQMITAKGGTQSKTFEDKPFSFKFNTGNHEYVWLRFDHNGMKSGSNVNESGWIYISEIGLYEGDVGQVTWSAKGGENYSTKFTMDELGFQINFDNGSHTSLTKDGFEWYNAENKFSYHALTYVASLGIPAGNPGKAWVKLPKEFTKRKDSLRWTVALRGYYYSTAGNFFPMHVHCSGGNEYEENGLIVCPIEGYCKIQNAQDNNDIQFRPLTAMIIAIA